MSVARITSISRNVTQEHLKEIFSHFGVVKNVILPKDDILDIPKGYAYVDFENVDDAAKAVENMNQGQIDGLCITVNLCDKTRLSQYISVSNNNDSVLDSVDKKVKVKENGMMDDLNKSGK